MDKDHPRWWRSQNGKDERFNWEWPFGLKGPVRHDPGGRPGELGDIFGGRSGGRTPCEEREAGAEHSHAKGQGEAEGRACPRVSRPARNRTQGRGLAGQGGGGGRGRRRAELCVSALTSESGPSLPGRSAASPFGAHPHGRTGGGPSVSLLHLPRVLHSLGSPPQKGVVLEGMGPTVKPPGPDPCPFASQPM